MVWSFASLFGVVILLGGDRAAPQVLASVFERRELAAAWEHLRFYMLLALGLAAGVMLATWSISYSHTGHADPLGHHPLAWAVLSIPINAAGALASRALQSAKYYSRESAVAPRSAAAQPRPDRGLLRCQRIAQGSPRVGARDHHHPRHHRVAMETAAPARNADLGARSHQGRPATVAAPSLPMMGVFIVTLALNQSDLYFLELAVASASRTAIISGRSVRRQGDELERNVATCCGPLWS